MQWLNSIVDEVIRRRPEGEILIESGSSPSGSYHLGHMRELVICDAILLELERRGRQARHIQFVDDLDALRKIPINIPKDYQKYLGYPICDIPGPEGEASYAAHFLQGLIDACKFLKVDVEYILSHEKYRSGYMVTAIERALERVGEAKHALETISGRQLDEHWTPIQVMEDGRLKNRKFLSIDKQNKTLQYEDYEGETQAVDYSKGEVKLDWRLDWPGRWWLQKVDVEPSGRDHMTKGSSYDTGVQIMKDVYAGEAPLAVAYDFINMAGDTKKMSASKGTGLDALEAAQIMPPEVMRFFILRSPPLKRLYFDPINGVVQLMDEFAAFAAKTDRSDSEEQLYYVATRGNSDVTVSRVPFSLLVASYQAALKDADHTLEIISRTEYAAVASQDAEIIKRELKFIDHWLAKHAPDEVKFELRDKVAETAFNEGQKQFLATLAEKITDAPADADGHWFHQAIYDLKDAAKLQPKEMFTTLYQAIIGQDSGPRAGWFLSILPREWLVDRLRLQK